MKAEDQFHLGLVVDDFDGTLKRLSALFGYEWCDEMVGPTSVTLPDGEVAALELRFAYSRTTPRLEIIRVVPGTLWEPVGGSGVHHVGYWSDDVPADSAALVSQGYVLDAAGLDPTGTPYWTFHSAPDGPRIELVSRRVQASLERYWSTGRVPS